MDVEWINPAITISLSLSSQKKGILKELLPFFKIQKCLTHPHNKIETNPFLKVCHVLRHCLKIPILIFSTLYANWILCSEKGSIVRQVRECCMINPSLEMNNAHFHIKRIFRVKDLVYLSWFLSENENYLKHFLKYLENITATWVFLLAFKFLPNDDIFQLHACLNSFCWLPEINMKRIKLKQNKTALAGVAQCIKNRPVNQRVASLIPSQGTCLGCRPGS